MKKQHLDYRKRIMVEVTDEQMELLNFYIPRGMKKHVFQILVHDLCEELKKKDPDFIGRIVLRRITVMDILKLGGNDE